MEFSSRLIQGEGPGHVYMYDSDMNTPEIRGTEDNMNFFRIAA